MAKRPSLANKNAPEPKLKKTLQGQGGRTKYAATSRNKAKKKYRGQGN